MTLYALVHGAWQRGAAWEPLRAELCRRGHEVVAVDLPTGDPAAGARTYADTVLAAVAGAPDIVVVGHSLGGLTAPVVAADLSSVRRLVLLAAMVPTPGSSWDGYLATQPRGSVVLPGLSHCVLRHDDGSTSFRGECAAQRWMPDAPAEVALEQCGHIRRQHWRITAEVTPLIRWPDVRTDYIVCAEDQIISPEWGRRIAPERFGADALELPGDHSPFLARAGELADLLVRD